MVEIDDREYPVLFAPLESNLDDIFYQFSYASQGAVSYNDLYNMNFGKVKRLLKTHNKLVKKIERQSVI